MGQDLREMFEKERQSKKFDLREGHHDRFFERLENELPLAGKPYFTGYKIAAAVLVFLGFSWFAYYVTSGKAVEQTLVGSGASTDAIKGISFGDLSPDLRNVEDYYLVNINLELSRLEISEDNKALVDSFMERLYHLNTEYKSLNTELNAIGPNDQTITALIKNLQLRLQLLQKLKKKLNELKISKNERFSTNTL